jgi:hypothetical protein
MGGDGINSQEEDFYFMDKKIEEKDKSAEKHTN